MPREKLSPEVRDAFRAFRYATGHTSRMLKGVGHVDISKIENDYYHISPAKALDVIRKAWGFDSFEALLQAAKGLPQPPQILTPEVRDAFRAFRYYTGQTSRMLKGVSQQDISEIENGRSISPSKALDVIQKAWGFDSFEALLKAAKGLPQRHKRIKHSTASETLGR